MANANAGPSAPEKNQAPSGSTARPRMTSQQSNSLPSTPRQRARDYGTHSRTPSPGSRMTGRCPRSASSESNRPMPPLRLAPSACRFMSTQTSRRRIPYTIGTDLLEKEEHKVKRSLDTNEERKLSRDMRELYDRLQPPPQDQERRQRVVDKLHKILSEEWPDKDLQVTVFGSSGNLLCTNQSDVDVCVMMKDLDTTCSLAAVLARRGMQKVTCVHAKGVPIVKIWDPELKLACDLNLNNHIGVTNTRMVRTYVELDERVRPLAMIVKYWTSKREINEASGGTLSSYTWIILLIFFLQTRRQPILPVLTLRDFKGQLRQDFSEDLAIYSGSGEANKETIGELLFHFFRYYGYEIDYQTSVVSVRKGKLLSKEEKGWQLATNNMLCVEEPFNNDRNLGNTADDTAFRGLHLEFRQAFERIAEGRDLEISIFEQFQFPTGETKTVFERPQSNARPTLTRSHSQSARGGISGGGRGGYRQQGGQRTSGNGRRASSAAAYGPNVHPPHQHGSAFFYPTTDYLLGQAPDLQTQMQTSQGIAEHLTQISQRLSREEQRLRLRQHQQALLLNQAQQQQLQQAQAHALVTCQSRSFSATYPGRMASSHNFRNSRTENADEPLTTAPPHRAFTYGSPLESASLSQSPSHQDSDTNPSSPTLTPAAPFRRTFQRGAAPSTSNTAVRSQSQPARSVGPQHVGASHGRTAFATTATSSPQNTRQEFQFTNGFNGQQLIGPFIGPYGAYYIPASSVVEPIPREYVGYGFGAAPPFMQYPDQPLIPSAVFDELRQQTRSGSPSGHVESISSSVMETLSRTPSPLDNYELAPDLRQSMSQSDADTYAIDPSLVVKPATNPAPLIVNGSLYGPRTADTTGKFHHRRASDSASHLHLNSSMQFGMNVEQGEISRPAMSQSLSEMPPKVDATTLVNGVRTPPRRSLGPSPNGVASRGNDKQPSTSTPPLANHISASPLSGPKVSSPEHSMHDRAGNAVRQGVVPLELSTGPYDTHRELSHPSAALLSPVRETPTPSPTTSRKADRDSVLPHINGVLSKDPPGSTSSHSSVLASREEHPPPTPVSQSGSIGAGAGLGIGIPAKGYSAKPDHRNGVSAGGPSEATVKDHSIPGNRVPASGPMSSNSNSNTNTWQLATSGKKNKKNRSNANSTAAVAAGAAATAKGAAASIEMMPASEAERKGG